MDEDQIKRVPIGDLRSEEGVEELLDSQDMEPYIRLVMARLQGSDVQPQLQAIADLRLEKRYVWRVASALKWAFADFDTLNVKADKDTLSDQDLAKVIKLLELRPMQFCLECPGRASRNAAKDDRSHQGGQRSGRYLRDVPSSSEPLAPT